MKKICFVLFYPQETYPSMTPPFTLTQQMNQCCSLARAGAEIRLQHCIFCKGAKVGRGAADTATCMQLPGKLPFHRVFTGSYPVKNALFTGFEIFYPATRNTVCTEDCCNVNK